MHDDIVTKWAALVAKFATERKLDGRVWTPMSVVVQTSVEYTREGLRSWYSAALVPIAYGDSCETVAEAFQALYRYIASNTPGGSVEPPTIE